MQAVLETKVETIDGSVEMAPPLCETTECEGRIQLPACFTNLVTYEIRGV